MKHLRQIDLENLKLNAGSGEGPVAVSREDFEALVENYHHPESTGGYDCRICDVYNEVKFKEILSNA